MLSPDDTAWGPPQAVIAELHLDGLSAQARVVNSYANGFQDLATFFQRLADDWRGWHGVRDWESIEGGLSLEARHEHGHVQLRVQLRRIKTDPGNQGWTTTGDLTIDPGRSSHGWRERWGCSPLGDDDDCRRWAMTTCRQSQLWPHRANARDPYRGRRADPGCFR
jgi:hypothetical protein